MFRKKVMSCLFAGIFLAFNTHLFASVFSSGALIAFKHAIIIDGNGGKPIYPGVLLIQNGTIIAVGEEDKISIPKNAKSIDVSGKTIMPTLITGHSHLGLSKGLTLADTNNTQENVLRQLKKFAQFGIGAVTSLGRDQAFIFNLRKQRNAGELGHELAYILTAGQGFGVPNGAPPKIPGNQVDPVYRPKNDAELSRDMETLAQKSPDVVKVWVDDFYHSVPKMRPQIYKDVIKKAHEHKLRVASHIYYLQDAKELVASGSNILEHSIRDKYIDSELIRAMKKNHVAIIPTLQLDEAYYVFTQKPAWMYDDFFLSSLEPGVLEVLEGKTVISSYKPKLSEVEVLKIAMKNIYTLHKNGILIGLGTDSGARVERIQGFSEHRELELLVQAGLSNMQALEVATANTAKIMGVFDTMGSLEPGKKANFIILNANPLDNIKNTQNIYAVWIDGKPVSRASVLLNPYLKKKRQLNSFNNMENI